LRPLGVGLIGSGGIALSAHIPAIDRLPGLVKLVATSDISQKAAETAAQPYGVDAYDDYRRVLDRKDVDMVIVCSPEFFHPEHVTAAAKAGKHILCEKPMATTLAGADAMIAAAKRYGVKLMVGHSRRFTTRYQEMRRAIDAGELGEIRLVRENERRSRPVAGRQGGYWYPGHWTANPEIAVGAILTNGIHETDLLRWFAGSPAKRVFAEHKVTRTGIAVPDFITFTVTFENGAIGSAEVSNCLPPGYPSFHQIEMYGTRGCLSARDTDQQGMIRFDDNKAEFPGSYEALLHFQDAYTLELSQFVRAVATDGPVPLPPEAAREALKLGLAAVESATTGRVVNLDSFVERGQAR
jgi:predicted dehydrogenase